MASWLLSVRCNSADDEKPKESACVNLTIRNTGRLREPVDMWATPPVLPSIPTFQEYVSFYPCHLH